MIENGTLIGNRYLVVRYLASGGMQHVYVAEDQLTDVTVALKTPQAGQAAKRFRQSAQLSARVNHHNVAKTLDYFEDNAAQFLVEELVEGSTLEAATLDVYPHLDPHLATHLMLRLSKGILASHAAAVAHRDLKPGNVLVGEGLSFTEVKLTDFGIATLAEELFEDVVSNGGDLTRSTSGTIQGAIPYMSPEMMFRKAGDRVGSEADIWSLAAMMFRLLTGEYPFGEAMMVPVNIKTNNRTAWPAFMVSNPQFAPLSRSLQAIVEDCLQATPMDRPDAASLVMKCEELCYNFSPRERGRVISREGGRCQLRTSRGEIIFFHMDSHYGSGQITVGSNVIFSGHPGTPFRRAHPVVLAA